MACGELVGGVGRWAHLDSSTRVYEYGTASVESRELAKQTS